MTRNLFSGHLLRLLKQLNIWVRFKNGRDIPPILPTFRNVKVVHFLYSNSPQVAIIEYMENKQEGWKYE